MEKCCLCGKGIDSVKDWDKGHNAKPLMDGRCCDKCNTDKVLPARMKAGMKEFHHALNPSIEPKTFMPQLASGILNSDMKDNLILSLCKGMAHSFFSCENFRVIELKDDLYTALEHTDNKLFYRHSPYDSFFINRDFKYKGLTAKGVLIIDMAQEKHLDEPNKNDLYVSFLAINKNFPNEEFSCYFKLSEIDSDTSNQNMNKEETENLMKLKYKVVTFAVSLIDFINSEKEVEYVTQHFHTQNKKRISKGKNRIPTTIHIRLHSELKLYVEDFYSKSRMKYSHQFLVRGHYKHFTHKRYKLARNKKIWVRPFWKGEGLKLKKDVVVHK